MFGIVRIEVRNNKPLNWNENIRKRSVKRLINERWVVTSATLVESITARSTRFLKYLSNKVGGSKEEGSFENDRRKPFCN